MSPHEQLVQKFYASFQQRDAQGMAECYHEAVEFSDPVFTNLHGAQATAMWRMLCERGKDLEITVSDIRADEHTGRAHWEARYTFSQSGRRVHNKIDATFKFKDGRIISHHDTFALWRWTRMALGMKGLLLGWLPAVQEKIRSEANRSLVHFMSKEK